MLRDAALGAAGASMVQTVARAPVQGPLPVVAVGAGDDSAPVAALPVAMREPKSYVTPAGTAGAPTVLRTQLADYIVAHSAYSTPLLRRNVLSELVTSEDQMGIASSYSGAADAAQGTLAGGGDAIRPISDPSR
jgi:hypothetical protein